MTVKELFAVWLGAVRYAYKDNTYRGSVVNVNHIIKRFGDMELSELTVFDIQSFYNSLMDEGYKAKTVRYIHCTFSSAMKYAQEMQLITVNPCKAVILPKLSSSFEYSVLTADELVMLLDYCRDNDSLVRIYLPVLLASCLGLRRGEILGLQHSDIKENVITIRRSVIFHHGERYISSPKTKNSVRHILISRPLMHEIDIYSHAGDYLCELTQNQLNARFKEVVDMLEIPHVRFHDLRHTYATLLLSHSIPAKIVSERLGHASIDITLDLYTHVDINMQKSASEVLDYIIKLKGENDYEQHKNSIS